MQLDLIRVNNIKNLIDLASFEDILFILNLEKLHLYKHCLPLIDEILIYSDSYNNSQLFRKLLQTENYIKQQIPLIEKKIYNCKSDLKNRVKLTNLVENYSNEFYYSFLNKNNIISKLNFQQISPMWNQLSEVQLNLFYNFCDVINYYSNFKILNKLDYFVNFNHILDFSSGSGLLSSQIELHNLKSHIINSDINDKSKYKILYNPISKKIEHNLNIRFDCIILSWVLHDWPDDDCVAILKELKNISLPNCRIFIFEKIHNSDSFNHFMDLIIHLHTGGCERNINQFEKIINKAGYSIVKKYMLNETRDVLEIQDV